MPRPRLPPNAATANLAIKVLRAVFAGAMNEGIVMGNDFKLKALDSDSVEKQAFTVPQVRRLLEVANPEWCSLILFALYTGQRLGDLVTLTGGIEAPTIERLIAGLQKSKFITVDAAGKVTYREP